MLNGKKIEDLELIARYRKARGFLYEVRHIDGKTPYWYWWKKWE